MLKHEFLPREHSEQYGDLDRSNRKDLKIDRSWKFIDPPIIPIIRLLNHNGYGTFSSCSGGHKSDMRGGSYRHCAGYIAFSPPTPIVFWLYRKLQRPKRRFDFEATTGITNEFESSKDTMYSKISWQLKARLPSRRNYYEDLFSSMRKIVSRAPRQNDMANDPRFLVC